MSANIALDRGKAHNTRTPPLNGWPIGEHTVPGIAYKEMVTRRVLSRADDAFSVTFVCTGNRARSVLAEALFRRYATDVREHVSVRSFGTLDVGPLPPLPTAVEAGRKLGVDVSDHRARALQVCCLADDDLVLGFESFHVASAVVDGGADIGRTFLLRELLDRVGTSNALGMRDADRPRAVIAIADARRTRTRPDASLEIADPFARPERMDATADEIEQLVSRLVVTLFGDIGARHAAASSQ